MDKISDNPASKNDPTGIEEHASALNYTTDSSDNFLRRPLYKYNLNCDAYHRIYCSKEKRRYKITDISSFC